MKKSFIILIVICSLLGIVGLLYKNNIIFNNKNMSKENNGEVIKPEENNNDDKSEESNNNENQENYEETTREDYSLIPVDSKDDVFNFEEDVVNFASSENFRKKQLYQTEDGTSVIGKHFIDNVDTYLLDLNNLNNRKYNYNKIFDCDYLLLDDVWVSPETPWTGFCNNKGKINIYKLLDEEPEINEMSFKDTPFNLTDISITSLKYLLTNNNKIIYTDKNMNLNYYETKDKKVKYIISERNYLYMETPNRIYPRMYVTEDNKLFTFAEQEVTDYNKYKYVLFYYPNYRWYNENDSGGYYFYIDKDGRIIYYKEAQVNQDNEIINFLEDADGNILKVDKVITSYDFLSFAYFISNNKVYEFSLKDKKLVAKLYTNKTVKNTKTIYTNDLIPCASDNKQECQIKVAKKFIIYYTDGTSEEIDHDTK